jgi:hypothetical protein
MPLISPLTAIRCVAEVIMTSLDRHIPRAAVPPSIIASPLITGGRIRCRIATLKIAVTRTPPSAAGFVRSASETVKAGLDTLIICGSRDHRIITRHHIASIYNNNEDLVTIISYRACLSPQSYLFELIEIFRASASAVHHSRQRNLSIHPGKMVP